MNTLLIFLAITFVVIVVSIALQKLLKCPILVAAIIFSVILLVAIIISNTTLIIAAIFLGILSYIVAIIQCILNRLLRNNSQCNNINSLQNTCLESNDTSNSCECNNNNVGTNNQSGTFYGCYRRR